MIVEDIMTKDVVTVTADMSIQEVANILAQHGIHGVPVVDADMKIMGIITETDFFTKDASNMHLPSFIDFIKNEKIEEEQKNESVEALLNATAADIMSANCFVVSPSFETQDLIKIFKEVRYKTIPVVDVNEKLVGIVTLADIIKLI